MANPATGRAVQIQTMDYYMIGWVPRYLVYDLFAALKDNQEYSARVVRVNSASVPTEPPVPHNLRVLIELKSQWQNHDPMDSEDYRPSGMTESSTDCSIQQRSALTKPVEVLNRLSVAWPFKNNRQFSLFTLSLRKQSTIESSNR